MNQLTIIYAEGRCINCGEIDYLTSGLCPSCFELSTMEFE